VAHTTTVVVVITIFCYTRSMYADILQELGLSPNEIKIYEALLTYGGSGVSTIALRAKIHRRNVYDTINRLLEKGLVYEVHSQSEVVYEPVEPTKLLEIAQEKVKRVEQALPKLTTAFHAKKTPERVYIYKGLEGMKNYLRETLTVGKDVYVMGAKGAWFDPRVETYMTNYIAETRRRKMGYYILYDPDVAQKMPEAPGKSATKFKYLPKGASTRSSFIVFGDYVVSFSGLTVGKWDDDLTIFVTVSPNLANAYRSWWKMIWDMLPEPKHSK
jgi:sugar-specific transcriptional regulator TrmB